MRLFGEEDCPHLLIVFLPSGPAHFRPSSAPSPSSLPHLLLGKAQRKFGKYQRSCGWWVKRVDETPQKQLL